ncbi:hypothetical protein BC828DRAFT_393093 [Blastocladiella britannica]|nr:hypothetical protein BC828DRAFT_393093 [Blastocladiella britannica]
MMAAAAPVPTSTSTTTTTTTPRSVLLERARALVADRDRVAAELLDLESVLASHRVGMDDPLVDASGFPRSDLDVYTIRHTRSSIIRRKNDLKQLYADIGRALEAVHQAPADPIENGQPTPASRSALVPFARVNAVAPDSPASSAGLLRDDQIFLFGSLDAGNHDGLKALVPLVAAHENQSIRIRILRRGSETPLDLNLTPSKWSGRGLLGCHLVPM